MLKIVVLQGKIIIHVISKRTNRHGSVNTGLLFYSPLIFPRLSTPKNLRLTKHHYETLL